MMALHGRQLAPVTLSIRSRRHAHPGVGAKHRAQHRRAVPLACAATPPRAPPASSLVADVVAGLSVAFVTVPQSLAYAALAGVSATQGLHTNAVVSVPAAALSPSRYLQTGAVAMTSMLTCGCLTAIGLTPHTPDFSAAAALLAGVVGIVRLILGVSRIGKPIVSSLPRAVLDGFGLGVVLLVAAAQIPAICGVPPPQGAHFITAALVVLAQPAAWMAGTIAVAALTAVLLLGGKRIHPLFPGAIVATTLGCAASVAGLAVGPTVGAVKSQLPAVINPFLMPWHLLPGLIPAGIAVALAGFAEAASISRRLADDDSEPWDTNKELVSQGASNIASAVFGGFPVGGSLSRTSLGRTAGARTQLAHAVTGLTVLAFLPLGASALSSLPRAVLGSLVACAMAPLMWPASSLWAPSTGAPLAHWRFPALGWATTMATLAASPRLEYGLAFGLFLAAALALYDKVVVKAAVTDAPLPPGESTAAVDPGVVYAR